MVLFDPTNHLIQNHPIDPGLKLDRLHHLQAVEHQGIFLSGISRLRGTRVNVHFDEQEWTILAEHGESSHGWIGHNQTLWIFDMRKQTLYQQETSPGAAQLMYPVFSSIVNDCVMDNSGDFWVATHDGLAHSMTALWNTPIEFPSKQKTIYSILESLDGRLWFISEDALICKNITQWSAYTLPDKVKRESSHFPFLDHHIFQWCIIPMT